MKPGETVFGFDGGNHLWVVISAETVDGSVVVVNVSSHGRRTMSGTDCVVLSPGDHPDIEHDSCMYYPDAFLTPNGLLTDAVERGVFQQDDDFSPELLLRVQ